MLLIKKNVRGTLIHEPENGRASLCPGDIDSRAWKRKSEVMSSGHWFM